MRDPRYQAFPDGAAVVFTQRARQAMQPSSAVQHPLDTPHAGADAVYTVTNTDDSFSDVILNETQQRYGVAWLEPVVSHIEQIDTLPITLTIRVSELAGIVQSATGPISLVGDHDGQSLITGEVRESGLVMGTLSIETEHGTVYLDPEADQKISVEIPVDEADEDEEDRAARHIRDFTGSLADILDLTANLWDTDYGHAIIECDRDGAPQTYTFITGGWSYNETLIHELGQRYLVRAIAWQKSERGGLEVYKISPVEAEIEISI